MAKTVTAWYNDKPRRVHQRKRKKYSQRIPVTSKRFNADHGLKLADACDIDSFGSPSSSELEETAETD